MLMPGKIQRYIFREALLALLLTFGVIVMAILLIDVVEQIRTIGSRTSIGLDTALQLTLLRTPALIMDVLPFATLIGAILTFSGLSRRSEIPVIRAAGISAWRFLTPAMLLAFVLGVVMVAVVEPMAASMNEEYRSRRNALVNPGASGLQGGTGVWLSQGDLNAPAINVDGAPLQANPDGQAIIHAQRVVGRAEALEDVTFYYFRASESGRDFTHRIDAKRAVLLQGFWQLDGGVVENFPGGRVNRQDSRALPTNLEPDRLLSRFASSKTIPFWDLPSFISQNRSAGMQVDAYVLKFHTLLATPAMMVAMTLIGAVVCLRLSRSGGLSRLIGASAAAGFILFFFTRVAASMSASGAVTPEAAAWCPPLFALFAVLTVLSHVEDG